jgi:isoquinoline 1-oxidoreductase subunit beta
VRVDPEPARTMPGVERVIPLESAVAVIADSWWRAEQAVRALDPVFAGDGGEAISQEDLVRLQDEALQAAGSSAHSQGDADGAIASAPAGRIVEAEYRVPYLHHAAMEPINATAQFADGTLTVWAGEQDALGAKALLAEISGLNARDVILHGLPVGGSFGRRIAQSADYMRHLVPIVMEMAPRPVKLILSREQEFAQGAYRPALATRIAAAIDEAGNPIAWSQRFLAGPTRNEAYALPYRIANQSLRTIDFSTHIHTGTWRAVAHTQHAYWTECFIDELAKAAGRDPFEYRRDLLPDGSRERNVLETAADRAGWHDPLPEGHGRGIALHESYGTWVAEVVEASLDNRGRPKVHRVVAAVDCGGMVHPDTALQQVEGGIIMGLSAALSEEITLADGAVVQSNFHDYEILRLADAPRIEVHFIESGAPRGGLGEPALPPAAPALANAVFAITGRPIRALPLRDQMQ